MEYKYEVLKLPIGAFAHNKYIKLFLKYIEMLTSNPLELLLPYAYLKFLLIFGTLKLPYIHTSM